MTVPQSFDSLIAKLIVTGASRQQALERSRRALAEFEVDGMPTVLPFHRAVVNDPAFTSEPFSVHTRWIETEFDGDIPPYSAARAASPGWPAGRGQAGPAAQRVPPARRAPVASRGRRRAIRPPGSGSWSRSAASGWKW